MADDGHGAQGFDAGQSPDQKELFDFCRENLSPQKTPLTWVFVDEFPLTASGEIAGHRIRGQIGNSSRDIRLRTVNGSVELLKGPTAPAAEASARR